MSKTLYMVVERFKGGDPVPVYRRFRDRGRLAPEGLFYISSWVDERLEKCFQLMETDNPQLLQEWIAQWETSSNSKWSLSLRPQRPRPESLLAYSVPNASPIEPSRFE